MVNLEKGVEHLFFFFFFNFLLLCQFVCFIFPILIAIAYLTLLERKVMASMQRRRGPNVVGFFGLLQALADGLKLLIKETVLPSYANVFVFFFSPIFTFFCSLILWLVFPFHLGVILKDFDLGLLYIYAISSFSVYGILFAGWSSNSKYAFLGSIRSAAQMISYEITLGFIFLLILLIVGSFHLGKIVEFQYFIWLIVPFFPVWIIFLIVSLAETNRAPFDLPEAEAELVAGYNVEYSGMSFALFFLGEYANMIYMSGLSVFLFFGGWHLPFFNDFILNSSFGYFVVSFKIILNLFIFIWVRATFPRFRYDQLMRIGWKICLPFVLIFFYFESILQYIFFLFFNYII